MINIYVVILNSIHLSGYLGAAMIQIYSGLTSWGKYTH